MNTIPAGRLFNPPAKALKLLSKPNSPDCQFDPAAQEAATTPPKARKPQALLGGSWVVISVVYKPPDIGHNYSYPTCNYPRTSKSTQSPETLKVTALASTHEGDWQVLRGWQNPRLRVASAPGGCFRGPLSPESPDQIPCGAT